MNSHPAIRIGLNLLLAAAGLAAGPGLAAGEAGEGAARTYTNAIDEPFQKVRDLFDRSIDALASPSR